MIKGRASEWPWPPPLSSHPHPLVSGCPVPELPPTLEILAALFLLPGPHPRGWRCRQEARLLLGDGAAMRTPFVLGTTPTQFSADLLPQ